MRGWLSAIAKERTLPRQITAYRELTDLFDFFAKLNIISLSAEAADLFSGFRKSGVKIGTMDLNMASIAVANNALFSHGQSARFRESAGAEIRELARMAKGVNITSALSRSKDTIRKDQH